ncbi:MAG TPA: MAPEG family protein, partial [Gammaproteobacteria bacterium]|nr:MAPEG family protein [Gammaproteobacteria bacterium]
MAFELQMLALVTFLLMLGWVPGFVCKYQTYGLGWMLSNRSTAGLPPLPEWGQRVERAYDNLQAHYPAFAVAVLLLALTGGFNLGTSLAAAVFAAARLVHIPAYTLGIVWLRVLSWTL